MNLRRIVSTTLGFALIMAVLSAARPRTESETFTATATVETSGGMTASAPVTIVIDRKVASPEADGLVAAFAKGGTSALRQALVALPPAGSIRLGNGAPTTTRLNLERATDKGRLLTIVSDKPILFLGAGLPNATPREGFDLAVVDIEVDAAGNGTGTLSPAAKVAIKQGAVVVADYASAPIRLTGVKKTQ
jgi:hypothetical protein